jgi:predicted DCC family thiol-disulfide oxidoreductase YuxK
VERYLVFDGACSVCSHLAQMVRDAAGDRLEAISMTGTPR